MIERAEVKTVHDVVRDERNALFGATPESPRPSRFGDEGSSGDDPPLGNEPHVSVKAGAQGGGAPPRSRPKSVYQGDDPRP